MGGSGLIIGNLVPLVLFGLKTKQNTKTEAKMKNIFLAFVEGKASFQFFFMHCELLK